MFQLLIHCLVAKFDHCQIVDLQIYRVEFLSPSRDDINPDIAFGKVIDKKICLLLCDPTVLQNLRQQVLEARVCNLQAVALDSTKVGF